MPTYLLDLDDPADRGLLAEALMSVASQQRRAAEAAAAELEAERREGVDVRTGAMKVMAVMAQARLCDSTATKLLDAQPYHDPPAGQTAVAEVVPLLPDGFELIDRDDPSALDAPGDPEPPAAVLDAVGRRRPRKRAAVTLAEPAPPAGLPDTDEDTPAPDDVVEVLAADQTAARRDT